MYRCLSTLLSILCAFSLRAQVVSDTLTTNSRFKAGEVVMPFALVGAGTLGFVEPLRNARFEVRDFLEEWRGDHRVTVDDYLQYVPFASYVGCRG